MRKPVLLFAGLLVVSGGALLLYSTSSLSRTTATATFSENADRTDLNELRVKAPYGYYVIHYSVVPRSPLLEENPKPFAVGGSGVRSDPIGLFGEDAVSSSFFPDTGTIDEIPVETHVRIASNLNPAATAEMPGDERILARCGIYLFVTKDRGVYERLESIVGDWVIGAGHPATRSESR